MKSKLFENLSQFTGTERWYRHALVRDVTFTDGAKYVADEAGAYWLLDEIALAQHYDEKVRAEPFQVWTLVVENRKGVLACDDGNGRVVLEKPLSFTDFPEPGITLYCCDKVILLPSEY